MKTLEAITEFAAMMRLGTSALRDTIANDQSAAGNLDSHVNQLLFLLDSIEEVSKAMELQAQSARNASA